MKVMAIFSEQFCDGRSIAETWSKLGQNLTLTFNPKKRKNRSLDLRICVHFRNFSTYIDEILQQRRQQQIWHKVKKEWVQELNSDSQVKTTTTTK